MDLGQKIKKLRLDKGMTLEQVGDAVGVGKSTVRKWETGEIANMGRDKIEKVAIALGVSPAYLMGWDEAKVVVERRPKKYTLTEKDGKVRVKVYSNQRTPFASSIKATTRKGVADLGEEVTIRTEVVPESLRSALTRDTAISGQTVDLDSETFQKFRKLDSYGKSVVRAIINLELNRVNNQNKEAHSNGMSEMQQDHT